MAIIPAALRGRLAQSFTLRDFRLLSVVPAVLVALLFKLAISDGGGHLPSLTLAQIVILLAVGAVIWSPSRLRDVALWPLAATLVVLGISVFWSVRPESTVREFLLWTFYAGVFALVAWTLSGLTAARRFLDAAVVIVGWVCLVGLYLYWGSDGATPLVLDLLLAQPVCGVHPAGAAAGDRAQRSRPNRARGKRARRDGGPDGRAVCPHLLTRGVVGSARRGPSGGRSAEAPRLGRSPPTPGCAGATGPIDGLPVAGPPLDVLRVVRQVGAHRVLIAQPAWAREETMRVAALCQEAGVPYAVLPDLYALLAVGADVEFVAGLPLLVPRGAPLGGWGLRVKDALDVIGGVLGLTLTLPVFLMISALIALDSPGPVFYRHKRIGKGGVPFAAWKFRTMRVNGEEEPGLHPDLEARFRKAYKLKDDPRVTRVGRWLRRTSLDELPQLFNVLKGEMSLVGPRPIVEEELSKYGPWERRLLCVKPGLTGLWQVFRHDEPDYERRVSLDMYYIDNWSLGLDLKILIRTLPAVLSGRGAY